MEFRRSLSHEAPSTSSQSFADILKKKADPSTVSTNINTSHPNLTSDIQDHNQGLAQTSSNNKIRRKIDKPIKEETNQTSLEKSFSNALKLSASKNAGKVKERNRGNSLMKGGGDSSSSRKPINLDSINLRRMRKEKGAIATVIPESLAKEGKEMIVSDLLRSENKEQSNQDEIWSKVVKSRTKRMKPKEVIIHPNRISADTFHRIGTSNERENYVLAQDDRKIKSKKKMAKSQDYDLEIEFVPEERPKFDDIEIEFVDPGKVDKFTNKISACTYRQIGKTESEKYVMSAGQSNQGRISESKKIEQPTLRDIHDMIKEKTKRGEELTPIEREVLRQKRRERRRREKEEKRRQRDEEKRQKILNQPKSQHIRFISADLLNKVRGIKEQESTSRTSTKKTNKSAENEKKGIKFHDEEYPDLNQQQFKRKVVLSRVVKDEKGKVVSDQETGSEWETDFSDVEGEDNKGRGEDQGSTHNQLDNGEVPVLVKENGSPDQAPLSYSSILKSAPKPRPIKIEGSKKDEKKDEKSSKNKADKNQPEDTAGQEKKKVKSKDPVIINFMSCVQEKKTVKKATPVIAGKIANERLKKVGNKLDSSAPAVRRGKEREGGKKRRLTTMKKIILAEKTRRKLEKAEAAARKDKNEKDDTHLTQNVEKELTECVDADSTEINISDDTLKDTVKEKEEATLDEENKASVETRINFGKEENEGKDEDKLNEEKAKKNIHTSKYRNYCDQELSTDLDAYVVKLMSDIIRFQDKAFVKDPVRAKMRKRYSVGLRETIKYLKVKKVVCVLLATDIERITSHGGLDTSIDTIKELCDSQNVPVVYTMSRWKLGRSCIRKTPVSSVAILRNGYSGSEENYNLMLDLQKQLKESYAARLQIEIQSLQTKKLRYVPGMDFVPGRPASSLKYSPGVEFVPKSELNYQVVDATKKKKKNAGKQNNQNQNFHNQRDRYGWKGWQSSGQFGTTDPMNAFYGQQPYHGYEFYNSENMWNPNQYMYESYNKGFGYEAYEGGYTYDNSNINKNFDAASSVYSNSPTKRQDPIETTTYNANLTSNAIPTPTTQTENCLQQEQQSSTATGFINSSGLADWNKLLQILKE